MKVYCNLHACNECRDQVAMSVVIPDSKGVRHPISLFCAKEAVRIAMDGVLASKGRNITVSWSRGEEEAREREEALREEREEMQASMFGGDTGIDADFTTTKGEK